MNKKSIKKIETYACKNKMRVLHKYVAIVIILFSCSLFTYSFINKAITYINRSVAWCSNQLSNTLLGYGLNINTVSLKGNYFVRKEDILKLIDKNQPILFVSLSRVKHDIESLSGWIKNVDIQRVLPNTINISIEEHKPFAVWHHGSQFSVIDATGYVITDDYPTDKLIFISGSNALSELAFIRMIMESNTELNHHICSFIHIQGRRWNIIFNNGLEVKLPKDNLHNAWNYLIDLHNTSDIIASNWKIIDMRTTNKIFMKK